MKAGSRQDASDAARSHLRAEHLRWLCEVADELRKPVHGLWHLDERIRPFVIALLSPGRDRQRADERASRGFCLPQRPRVAQRQNRESLARRIVRPALGLDSRVGVVRDAGQCFGKRFPRRFVDRSVLILRAGPGRRPIRSRVKCRS